MNRIRIAVLGLLLLPAITLAGADDGTKPQADQGRICTMESPVGSHMQRRVCTTAAERQALQQRSQNAVGRLQERGPVSRSPGSGR